MTEATRPDPAAARQDEERLAHALISRGLLTREEVQGCPADAVGPAGPRPCWRGWSPAALLTANQAKRATRELETLLGQQIPGYTLLEQPRPRRHGHRLQGPATEHEPPGGGQGAPAAASAPTRTSSSASEEAHLAARLSHNNIVQAIDVGSAGVVHYFVMELVEGRTIKEDLEAGKVYDEHEAVEMIVQIAQAVQHASRRGLIHRDIKPANVILTAEGIAKLADLGLARATADTALAADLTSSQARGDRRLLNLHRHDLGQHCQPLGDLLLDVQQVVPRGPAAGYRRLELGTPLQLLAQQHDRHKIGRPVLSPRVHHPLERRQRRKTHIGWRQRSHSSHRRQLALPGLRQRRLRPIPRRPVRPPAPLFLI